MGEPRLRRLQEIASQLVRSVDSAHIIDLIVQEGVIALDAHVGRACLLTDDGMGLQGARVTTHPEAAFSSSVIDAWDTFAPDASAPIADAVRTRTIIVLESREERARRYPHLADRDDPIHAWVVSPILLPSRAIGVIELNFPHPLRLEDEDRAYITTLTELCAQALDRARMDETLRVMKEQGRAMKTEFQRLRQQYQDLRADYRRLVEDREAARQMEDEARLRKIWQYDFVCKMLSEATAGGLRLCHESDELPALLATVAEPIDLSQPGGVRTLRHIALSAAKEMGFSAEREYDLEVAVGEAGTNAISHAGGGFGTVSIDPGQRIQIRITDLGKGIALEDVPRATLARGYSTRKTLGHGFKIVLQTIDRVYLLTNPSGTTVVLEQDNRAEAAW